MKERHILVDMQPLYTAHASRGIGTLYRNVVKRLVKLDENSTYYLLNLYGEIPAELKIGSGDNVRGLDLYEDVKEYIYEGTDERKKAYFDAFIQSVIREYDIDICLIGAVVDYYNVYSPESFGAAKMVTVAHDLIPMIYSDRYLTVAEAAFRHYQWFAQYLYSDYILSNSLTTKNDLVRHLGVDVDRVSVIYGGTSPIFRKNNYTTEEKERVFQRFGIQGEYLFCVGADDFRKNLDGLAEAYLGLPEELTERYQLVITCEVSEETKNRLLAYDENGEGSEVLDDPKKRKRLVVTGFVTDDEMVLLLNCAKLAAFPSMYEGLGLPVIEAWKCGVPVLTSNNSSLGEIAEDAAVTVDPFSVEDIRRGLLYALTEADLGGLVARGAEKSKRYTYENAAKTVLDSYEKIDAAEKIDTLSRAYREKQKNLKRQCMENVDRAERKKYRDRW